MEKQMAYNISMWKTKELVEFTIPVWTLYANKSFQPESRKLEDTDEVEFRFGDSIVRGTVIDEILCVTKIRILGEGSGSLWNWVLQSALTHSKGKFVAVRVWEGGDNIDKVSVDNGDMRFEDIIL
jgi:hypothetical protein